MSADNPVERFWGKVAIITYYVFVCFFVNYYLITPLKVPDRCGVVQQKATPSEASIHKSVATIRVEEYFVVRFDDGKYETVNVDTNTFYNRKVGDQVCFAGKPSVWFIMISIIGGMYVLIGTLFFVVVFVEKFNAFLTRWHKIRKGERH